MLAEIKSKMLLPRPEEDDDEEDDPQVELSKDCKNMKDSKSS